MLAWIRQPVPRRIIARPIDAGSPMRLLASQGAEMVMAGRRQSGRAVH